MLGNSKEIQTQIAWGQTDLDRWLRENDVTVLDIKYAISASTDKFLIIYLPK